MYAIVSPFWNTFDDIGLTYFIPEHLRDDITLYQVVEIPLKDKIEIAVVLKIEETSDIEQSKLKCKSNLLEVPKLCRFLCAISFFLYHTSYLNKEWTK